MLDYWPMLLGWPAIVLALVLAITGIARDRSALLVTAAILITPMSLYVAAAPRFGIAILILPLLLVGAAAAVRRSSRNIAWLALFPVVSFYGWLALMVASA